MPYTPPEPALMVFIGLAWPLLWWQAWKDAHSESLRKALGTVAWWIRVCLLGGLGVGAMVVLGVGLARLFAQKI